MGKLPAEGTQARRFGKTRSAQSTALLEDYAELIADLLEGAGEARPTDIARRLGRHAERAKEIDDQPVAHPRARGQVVTLLGQEHTAIRPRRRQAGAF